MQAYMARSIPFYKGIFVIPAFRFQSSCDSGWVSIVFGKHEMKVNLKIFCSSEEFQIAQVKSDV